MNFVKNQNGSILIYIFIAVALFAALSYVVSQMMRGGAESISKETSELYVSEILQYAATVRNGVQNLRISNNCSDIEISFENNIVEEYENTNAPSDYSCHVFHPAGASLSWIKPQENVSGSTNYHFESRRVTGAGSSSEDDLIMGLADINKEICQIINKKLHSYSGEPFEDSDNMNIWGDGRFTGTYSTGAHINHTDADKHQAACFESQSSGIYHFYQVLIAR